VDKIILGAGMVPDDLLFRWMRDAKDRRELADQVAIEYEYRKPRVERGITRKLLRLHGTVDDWRYRQEMSENWTLNDLIKKHAWHRDESASLNAAIQTQLLLRQMMESERAKGRVSA
jgi:hypothetical protein